MNDEAYIAALLRERHGYIVRDLPERVALVDSALTVAGYKPEKAVLDDPTVEKAGTGRRPRKKASH